MSATLNTPKKSIPRRQITYKQRNFAQKYIEHNGNATQAALAVYDTDDDNTAHAIGSQNLRKLTVRDEIMRLSRLAGFDERKAINRLASRAQDDEHDRWALPLWFDVMGLKAPQKVENTHKIEYSDEERRELSDLRNGLSSQVIDTKQDIT